MNASNNDRFVQIIQFLTEISQHFTAPNVESYFETIMGGEEFLEHYETYNALMEVLVAIQCVLHIVEHVGNVDKDVYNNLQALLMSLDGNKLRGFVFDVRFYSHDGDKMLELVVKHRAIIDDIMHKTSTIILNK